MGRVNCHSPWKRLGVSKSTTILWPLCHYPAGGDNELAEGTLILRRSSITLRGAGYVNFIFLNSFRMGCKEPEGEENQLSRAFFAAWNWQGNGVLRAADLPPLRGEVKGPRLPPACLGEQTRLRSLAPGNQLHAVPSQGGGGGGGVASWGIGGAHTT